MLRMGLDELEKEKALLQAKLAKVVNEESSGLTINLDTGLIDDYRTSEDESPPPSKKTLGNKLLSDAVEPKPKLKEKSIGSVNKNHTVVKPISKQPSSTSVIHNNDHGKHLHKTISSKSKVKEETQRKNKTTSTDPKKGPNPSPGKHSPSNSRRKEDKKDRNHEEGGSRDRHGSPSPQKKPQVSSGFNTTTSTSNLHSSNNSSAKDTLGKRNSLHLGIQSSQQIALKRKSPPSPVLNSHGIRHHSRNGELMWFNESLKVSLV